MTKIKTVLGVHNKKSLIIINKNCILNPAVTIGELAKDYGVVIFLTYREAETFG